MQKILFLDIDGPLIPSRMYKAPGQTRPWVTMFDPAAVGMLNTIADKTGCKFVVHSSWVRTTMHYDMLPKTNTPVLDHMINQGILADYFHDDWIAQYTFSGNRWHAISDWIIDQDNKVDYLILDDAIMPPDFPLDKARQIIVNFDEGFTYAQFQYILDL